MILEELYLSSFKGFRDYSLRCSKFTCLVGLNNSGKTSILQAIQLLYDLFVLSFGNGDKPDFSGIRWQCNPSDRLNKVSLGDPEALWLFKKTSNPCKISARFSGGIEIKLIVNGPNNYELDLLVNETSIHNSMASPEHRKLVEDLFAIRPTYISPVGPIAPMEAFRSYPNVNGMIDTGKVSECWRSHLYWLYNDGRKDVFDEVVQRITSYLHDVTILPPRLTHSDSPQVLIQYTEKDTTFDISTSGGGLRTILNLAVVLQFSQSKCLLFDEPDAHLHATLQKAISRMLFDFQEENDVQVFVASHAPDFIAELPVDSLAWIDRTKSKAGHSDELGRILADLGALSKADAIRTYGADKILFVEGSLDRNVLGSLFQKSSYRNPFDDPQVIIATLPSGKGDSAYLEMFCLLLRETFKLDITIACITDQDYDLPQQTEENITARQVLVMPLGRKEVENFLLDPDVILTAIRNVAEKRQVKIGQEVVIPTAEQVQAELDKCLNQSKVRDILRWQIVPRYRRDKLSRVLNDSKREEQGEQWFEKNWANPEWRMKNCPGKQVLAGLRRWSQATFNVTLTPGELIRALTTCPADVCEIARRLEEHYYSA